MRLNGGLAACIVVALLVVSLGFALGCTGGGGCSRRPGKPAEFDESGGPWRSPSTGIEFVYIEALGIWAGKYEVTNAQYRLKEPGHDSKTFRGHTLNRDRQRAVHVNFEDGRSYAEWMTEQDKDVLPPGYRYRLPTESEWMILAQCGDGREYPWGNSWPPERGKAGNYRDDTSARVVGLSDPTGYNDGFAVTADVNRLWVNPWGLAGVGGNVWEICESDSTPGSFGAWRGASWNDYSRDALRCSYRIGVDGSYRGSYYGFRLVLSR